MKKALLGLLLFVSCTYGGVVSKPVGVISVSLEPHKLYHLSMPFNNTNAYNSIISQLSPESTITAWDRLEQRYILTKPGQQSPPLQTINAGDAFYISVPEHTKLKLYGWVPDATNTVSTIPNGISMHGFAYPTVFNFSNSDLSKDLENGSLLLLWDNNTHRYNIFRKTKTGWPASDILISPQQGFWIKRKGGELLWETVKPYLWP